MSPRAIASLAAALGMLGCSTALAATRPRPAHRPRACAHRAYRLHHPRRCRVEKSPAPAKPPPAAAPATSALAPAPAAPLLAAPAGSAPQPFPQPEPKEEAPAIATPEGEAEPPSVPHVQVTAQEWSFTLSRSTVPAGKVVLEFVNSGQDEHNLNLTPPEGPSEEPVANTQSKGVADVTVQMAPGSYTLFCSLPTHEQKGMKATLTVE